jgi:hypothetical protein
MSPPADGGAIWSSPGSDDDRSWFACHPRRSYRLRPAFPDEVADIVAGGWTIVRQIAPGVRVRACVILDHDDPDDGEANARRLFKQIYKIDRARRIVRAIERLAR